MIAKWNDILYVVSEFNRDEDFTNVKSFSSLELAKEEFCSMVEKILDEKDQLHVDASHMGDYLPEEWMYEAVMNGDLAGWEAQGYPEKTAWVYSVGDNEVKCKIYEFDEDLRKMTLAHVCVLHASCLDSLTDNFFCWDYAESEFRPFTKDTWEWKDGYSIQHYSIHPDTSKSDTGEGDVWKVCVRTSLPETCMNSEELKENIIIEQSFDKAKEVFQKIVREYAFSENAMFNGKGEIINFKDYEFPKCDDEEYDFWSGTRRLFQEDSLKIQEALKGVFSGENVDISELFSWEQAEDCMIQATMKDEVLRISTGNDGYLNGIAPRIETNAFDMTGPDHYYLYIDDLISVETSAELYIDLVKA